jgi:hypothetical protein
VGDDVSELTIRPAGRDEVGIMIDWAAAEGWNPGHVDAEAFYAADPEGFLLGFLGEEPVAAVSVVAYGAAFGFLGLYLCRPEHRGRGYGLALWHAGMARLGDRTVGLDGVVAQQANYARSGFVLAHRNVRFAGRADVHETADPRLVALAGSRPAGLAGAVVAYDAPLFAGSRGGFLRHWIAAPGHRTVVFVEENTIRGYGTIRPCRVGHKVGPLFADTPEIAERLFAALVSRHHGDTVSLDLPEPNAEAMALARRHGMEPVFETARMYRGRMPELPLSRIYGITSFELG